MRYVFMIYGNEASMKTWPDQELKRCVSEALEYDELLKRRGNFIVAHALEWPSQATVLRKRSGKVVSTDGPFTETKEQLLGFFLIEAKDRDEAIALASKSPMLATSTVELRAVEQLEGEVF